MDIKSLKKWVNKLDKPMSILDRKKLRQQLRFRIHINLLGSDDNTDIGIPPTPMWETGQAYKRLNITTKNFVVVDYYLSIENLMDTEIYDFTERELDYIARLMVEHYEQLP